MNQGALVYEGQPTTEFAVRPGRSLMGKAEK
jgi:hypothetical protein